MAAGAKTLSAFAANNGTDQALVSAVPGMRICVVAFSLNSSAGSTTTFNSKGSGAGTAISASYVMGANGGHNCAYTADWFRTNPGEALTTTNAAATNIHVVYRLAPG